MTTTLIPIMAKILKGKLIKKNNVNYNVIDDIITQLQQVKAALQQRINKNRL